MKYRNEKVKKFVENMKIKCLKRQVQILEAKYYFLGVSLIAIEPVCTNGSKKRPIGDSNLEKKILYTVFHKVLP